MRSGTVAAGAFAAAALLAAGPAAAQAPEGWTMLERPGFALRAGLETGVQVTVESNAFWNLDRVFARGSGYAADTAWVESYATPALGFEATLAEDFRAWGRLSAVASSTLGTDAFDVGDTGRVTLEDAVLGLGFGREGAVLRLDLSAGAQSYVPGTGMLLADGGADGFERGALIFGPRRAWEMTALARLTAGAATVEAFYLDANELSSSDTGTRIAGAALTWAPSEALSLGLGGGAVFASSAPYVQAAPGGVGVPAILPNGRDGLRFVTGWGRWTPAPQSLPGLWFAAEGAVQTLDRIDLRAWGGRVQAGHVFADLRGRPALTYGYQTFSGDDPRTSALERFDPLFPDAAPDAWASGANASLLFLNSNVAAHQVAVALTASPRDYLTFRWFHVRANERHSPLQFGQGARAATVGGAPALIAGVTDDHLSDDLYAEYTRVLTPRAFLTTGVSVTIPGAGIRALSGPAGDPVWVGAFANVVLRF